VAAKQKPAQERQANMDQHAAPPPQRLRVINEDVMDENELGDETEMEEISEQNAESPAAASGAYMVHTDEVIEYFNAVLPQPKDADVCV